MTNGEKYISNLPCEILLDKIGYSTLAAILKNDIDSCDYCGTKIRLHDEPQLPFSIEVELHESNGNWIASHDSVRIW